MTRELEAGDPLCRASKIADRFQIHRKCFHILFTNTFCLINVHISDAWLNLIMWQVYLQYNLNLFSAGSSVQTLIQGRIIWYIIFWLNLSTAYTWGKLLDVHLPLTANVILFLKTSWRLTILHSSPKEVHIDFTQYSQWPPVTDPYPGSWKVCQMVLGVICKRPCSKIPCGSGMTQGQGQWPSDLTKLGLFSCALLLEKSVDIHIIIIKILKNYK